MSQQVWPDGARYEGTGREGRGMRVVGAISSIHGAAVCFASIRTRDGGV